MEIYVYGPDFNLPSIDLDCLKVLTYIKIREIPVIIKQTNQPHHSPDGFLPYLIDGSITKTGANEIIKYFKSKGFDLNENIPQNYKTISESESLKSFNEINPILQYHLWGMLSINDTRSIYGKQIPFPFNFYYPKKYIHKTKLIMDVLCGINIDEPISEIDVEELTNKTNKYLNSLSNKLKQNKWFITNSPTDFDIIIYSYLSVLHKFKFTKNPIQLLLKDFSNLTNFVDRITKKYFKDEIFQTKVTETGNNTNENGNDEDDSRKIQVLAGLCAVFAMIGYALANGIIPKLTQQTVENLDHENFVEYYDEDYDGQEINKKKIISFS